jgi:hypothetical protein
MKKIIPLVLILFCFNLVKSQQVESPRQLLANKIAQRMKDSLVLSKKVRDELARINLSLADQKAAAWSLFTDSTAIRNYLQQVENTRDSLYKTVLPEDKYLLYQQRKRRLVNNN